MPAAMTQRGLKHQSLLELIASCPPSRPRNGTIVGWFQQIATTAIVPFNTGLWQHSSQAFSGLSGKFRQTVKSRHFVPTAWWERCVVDEFSSTASGEGLTNDCSVGALPGPDRSNNPELNCVLPFHSDFDFAGLEGLESLKVGNTMPQKIASSSPMATVRSFSFSDTQKRYVIPAEGAR